MKCKHMHKDFPEQSFCEDCFQEVIFNKEGTKILKLIKVKGGIKHENN